jgi:hypothetical protein
MFLAAAAVALALIFTGCQTPTDPDPKDTVVNAGLNLTSLVTAPAKDAAPITTFTAQTQYTGAIVWQTNAGAAVIGNFAAGTVYKAVLTLTAKSGYTFDGIGANAFTYTGATSVTNAANSGVVTITFPATAAEGGDTVVNAGLDLTSLVTAPIKDAAPITTFTAQTQYTGVIAWQTSAGAAVTGNFAAGTVYKAVLTLTAKSGYTFDGIGANSFTYSGATSVTNTANGSIVTITFPATAAGDTVVNAGRDLTSLVTAPVKDVAPVTTFTAQTQYAGVIAWQTNAGAAVTGDFAAGTVYKAVLTLAAESGYTFAGIGANAFSYTGATSVTNTANGSIVTITFPATAAGDTVVNAGLDLTSLVTAPIKDAAPVTTFTAQTQYTGAIAWQTNAGAAVTGDFAAGTVYKAVLTLTANGGYTFEGIGANSFTYSGATSVTNTANSNIVTITFPATAANAPGTGTAKVIYTWVNEHEIVTSASAATLSRGANESLAITVTGSGYSSYQWSYNGADAGTAASYTFTSAGKGNGKYYIGLRVKRDNAWYSTLITITVTD